MKSNREVISFLYDLINLISDKDGKESVLSIIDYINQLEDINESEYIRGNNAGYIRAWEDIINLMTGLDHQVKVNVVNCSYINRLKELININKNTQENLSKIKELTKEIEILKSFLKTRNELELVLDYLPQYFMENSQSIDPAFEKIVNDNFWELLA